ncbi:MAG: elongation factor Ts [bacterium]|nr:elongation factor Ts [bacterium]
MSNQFEQLRILREKTGAGVLECSNALKRANGDIEKAIKILREEGAIKVEKLRTNTAKEGIVYSYIHHNGKIGVLIELNCETDFVAKTPEFQNLAKEIALQIAASEPRWIRVEDIPIEVIEKEKEIYLKQVEGKPESVKNKIIENKLNEFYSMWVLYKMPYIKDPKIKIEDLINEVAVKVKENVFLSRFSRFEVGKL